MTITDRCRLRAALLWILLAALGLPLATAAEEASCPCPPAPPPPPLWTGSLGLSYLSTTGNTDTSSLGLSTAWSRQPTPWGLDITAMASRAESGSVETAERLFAGLRGKRKLSDRLDLFAGLSWERNQFAGFDSRDVVETGAVYHALTGPDHGLAFDAGLTWTREELVGGSRDDYFGALAGVTYAWQISEGTKLVERLVWYPNFDTSQDWRLSSETAAEAALAGSWALRISYLYLRENRPPAGFEESDTSTGVSLVWRR